MMSADRSCHDGDDELPQALKLHSPVPSARRSHPPAVQGFPAGPMMCVLLQIDNANIETCHISQCPLVFMPAQCIPLLLIRGSHRAHDNVEEPGPDPLLRAPEKFNHIEITIPRCGDLM